MAWELEGREEKAWPLGILKAVGEFHRKLGGRFQKQGFQKPSYNQTQPPAKLNKNQHRIESTIYSNGLCP